MDLRSLINRWSSVTWLALFLAGVGCSEAVKMVQDTPTGGVATYSYKEDRGGHMFSSYRKQAFELMQKKCSSGYKILREGEARGYTSVSGIVEGTEDEIRNRRWGMQFRCKPG